MAIIEKKKKRANSTLERWMARNKKVFITILYYKVSLRGVVERRKECFRSMERKH